MKKVLGIIRNVIVWLIVVLAVGMMIFTIISVKTFDRTNRNIFGYKAFIVLSDSMSATDFSAGDLVLVKQVDPSSLKEGDIISYQSTNPDNYGEVVTHKIRSKTLDAYGNKGFITYGTTTDSDDEVIVTYEFVLGKYKFHLAGVGNFFNFLKTTPGYIICIFLPFLILILIEGLRSIRLFKKYKQEQMRELKKEKEKQALELDEERKRVQAELAESRRMIADLMKIKSKDEENKDDLSV